MCLHRRNFRPSPLAVKTGPVPWRGNVFARLPGFAKLQKSQALRLYKTGERLPQLHHLPGERQSQGGDFFILAIFGMK